MDKQQPMTREEAEESTRRVRAHMTSAYLAHRQLLHGSADEFREVVRARPWPDGWTDELVASMEALVESVIAAVDGEVN